MTPAQKMGLILGNTYNLKEGNDYDYSTDVQVKFIDDDETDMPRFEVPKSWDSDGWMYLSLDEINPVAVLNGGGTCVMTPAQAAGFEIGRKYVVAEDGCFSFITGDVVTFVQDDETDIPRFENEEGHSQYVHLPKLKPVASVESAVTFTDEEVVTYVTVIRAGRKLSQSEKQAIQASIDGGVV